MKKTLWLIISLVVLAAMVLTACQPAATEAPAEEQKTEAPAAEEKTEAPAAEEGVSGKLEIFSWWTAGGEAEGLNAMFDVYKKCTLMSRL